MSSGVAIVGMACRYPDARNPGELWENVLAQRRAFRRLPPERLRLEDYYSNDLSAPDAIYAGEAAVIEGYDFDRVRFRVAGPAFRSVDLAHWLALDVADQALSDAGFPNGRGIPLETTGVLVGNTLTGEFSRAATLRLRWPYVRRVMSEHLGKQGWSHSRRSEFLGRVEEAFKSPFPPVGEESLAGALSNTIAGRICNYFHFGGGGYTVDGACSSSLLAVANACSALQSGELDAALAGGVDLSLDPFELVGFAKAGALAHGEMRIYDKESSGFLPGEGSGFVVLMREADAIAQRMRIYALIRGWGVSSDGGGGITRPESGGQTLALKRAYRHAGYEAESVALFEGHGTGTPVGDDVELKTLSATRRTGSTDAPPAAIGSIKANIGHTKAAAGVAGLIKAALAVHHRVLPPTTGVRQPRPEVEGNGSVLRVLTKAEPWPIDTPVRAGVNSFGFGGIDVHVTIEGHARERTMDWSARERLLSSSAQDVEIFFFDGDSPDKLLSKVEQLAQIAPDLSYSELADVSAVLADQAAFAEGRAAIVAASPAELAKRLRTLRALLREGKFAHLDIAEGVFLGNCNEVPRIGFLFPGQASPVRLNEGVHGRRFDEVAALYRSTVLPSDCDNSSTEVAQIAIIIAELAGLRLLDTLGITGTVAVGHSLGELAAYRWAGSLDESSLLEVVRLRGRLMSQLPGRRGMMASIGAGASEVASLIENDGRVAVACLNAARQTVVSGEREAVAALVFKAQSRGWTSTILSAADAFHSPLMEPAVHPFRSGLASFEFQALRKTVFSTITGSEINEEAKLNDLLVAQLTNPVQFFPAMAAAERRSDLFVEVGPGTILTHLSTAITQVPAVSLDMAGSSLSGLLKALAAAYVLGAQVRFHELFKSRFTRPIDLTRRPKFFANPCELDPVRGTFDDEVVEINVSKPKLPTWRPTQGVREVPVSAGQNALAIIRALVASRTELPPDSISKTARLLRDLHLNSIVVSEIVVSSARAMGIAPPADLLRFSDASVGEVAAALDVLCNSVDRPPSLDRVPAGIDDWYRAFIIDWAPRLLPNSPELKSPAGRWCFLGPSDHELLAPVSHAVLPGNGVVVCLTVDPIEQQLSTLLTGAQKAIAAEGPEKYFVVLGPVRIAGAFARTLNLEHPDVFTRVLEGLDSSDGVCRLKTELSAKQGHIEARYETNGRRCEPCFTLPHQVEEEGIPIQRGEVVLVTGGAKGIGAECASALAKATGAKLVLLGRSSAKDALVSSHVRDLESSGITATYIQTDVTDSQAVLEAVRSAEQINGPIAGIIHAAGRNLPTLIRDLDESKLRDTLAPKLQGFRNLVAAVRADDLRLLVCFSSVIGRIGLRGEADYALANASLSALTEEFARFHPHCRCLAFESSAWLGIGMAERLGKVETLRSAGVTPIPPAEGTSQFLRLIATRLPGTSVVVTGRLGTNSPIPMDAPEPPLLRFVERPRVFYPGVEIIADADLSTASDPYLLDHVFNGQPLLPAVVGLEAMLQSVMALRAGQRIPVVEHLQFEHPVIVEAGTHVTLRVAALVRESGKVDVVLRSSQTSFQLDHFRCSCVFPDTPPCPQSGVLVPPSPRIPVDPQRDLYGGLLFQEGRFRRLAGYRGLSARFSWADIAPGKPQSWFGSYLPGAMLLGDAAARDAALHSIQACVPDAILLPTGVDRIQAARLESNELLVAHAWERWQEGSTYCYDLELQTPEGEVREFWQGLRLRKVEDAKAQQWPDPLIAAFLEWRLRRTKPAARVFVAFERDRNHDPNMDHRRRSERAIQRALDGATPVHWRSNGKPEVDAPMAVSAAHSNGLTLGVAAPTTVACDIEAVFPRPDNIWRDLLGPERCRLAELIAREADEDFQTSATRVWTAIESLAKADSPPNAPLMLIPSSIDHKGSVSLAAPALTIDTSVLRFEGHSAPVAVAILTRDQTCTTTNTDTESLLKRRTS